MSSGPELRSGEDPSVRASVLASGAMELTAAEGRVLGCLIEQEAVAPDAVPLTLNTLRLACNQSTNRDPVVAYEEAEIRTAVFGRSPDADDPEDTLVRVQASQLRKRLQVYFATEGADEPTVIEVPKGSYSPVFKPRPPEPLPPPLPPTAVPAPPPMPAAFLPGTCAAW